MKAPHKFLDLIEEDWAEMDSLELLAFIHRVENTFEVIVPASALVRFRNYDDVAQFVIEELAGRLDKEHADRGNIPA